MPAIDTPPPERTSAQVIDFQAVRLRAGLDPAPLRAFAVVQPDLLSPQERWALEAVVDHFARRDIAMPQHAIDAAWDPRLGRFDLPKAIAEAVGDKPIVLPLPAGRVTPFARLFGGAL